MKPLHGALLLTGLAIAIWLAGYLSDPEVEVISSDMTQPPVVTQSDVQKGDITPATLAANPSRLKTFRGASVDGELRTDLHGALIVDMALRRWIDFYLSAQGEVPLNELVAAMHLEMDKLAQPGRTQAVDLLEDYLGYLGALGEYDEDAQRRQSGADFDAAANRIEWQQRLRREWLQPQVVKAFFADDEVLDSYTIQRIRLVRAGAGADEIAALEKTLPEDLQQMRAKARSLITLSTQEQQMQAEGDSAQAVQAWREQTFGSEAAQRLAEVDARKQEWQQRLHEYKDYSGSLALKGLSDADREQLLDTYRKRHFSESELKRLPAAMALLAAE